MKHLVAFIDAQLKEQGITLKELGARMNLDPTIITKLRSGAARDISTKSLIDMQNGISEDPEVRAELLRSYLLDKRQGPAAALVEVRIPSELSKSWRLKESTDGDAFDTLADISREYNVDGTFLRALKDLIRLASSNRHLRNVVIEIVKLESKRLKKPDTA